MVMSKITVMSNIMNFQDFDILSDGMFEIRGLYLHTSAISSMVDQATITSVKPFRFGTADP